MYHGMEIEMSEQEARKPRAYTVDEMRRMLLDHLGGQARYWATCPLVPESSAEVRAKGETLYRLEGLVFSFLVLLDGGSGDMPAFDLTPSQHDEFHRGEGENWWPSVVINDCHLHDLLKG